MLHGNEACRRCAYWQRFNGKCVAAIGIAAGKVKPGLCRRQPPIVRAWTEVGRECVWPVTGEDEWCGEFVKAPPKKS